MPRYPQIQVTLHSRNPLALVGAVRLALRRAGIDPDEIHCFSDQAMASPSAGSLRRVCADWVEVRMTGSGPGASLSH